MAHSLIHRLPALLVASAAAAMISAAPALASEGPAGPAPPGSPPLPAALSPVNFAPMPAAPGNAVRKRSRPAIRRAKLASRRIRRGRHARLRLSLSTTGRVRIILERNVRGRRVRSAALTMTARATKLTVRLPARAHGRALPAGRYRITITAIDAEGSRSRPVRRSLVIRRKAR
jgi:hypothetical protein